MTAAMKHGYRVKYSDGEMLPPGPKPVAAVPGTSIIVEVRGQAGWARLLLNEPADRAAACVGGCWAQAACSLRRARSTCRA